MPSDHRGMERRCPTPAIGVGRPESTVGVASDFLGLAVKLGTWGMLSIEPGRQERLNDIGPKHQRVR
jgi:hypothetical protein